MTYSFPTRALGATLVLSALWAGCDDTPEMATPDMGMGPIVIPPRDPCTSTGAEVRYRVTALHIPTPAEANDGATVGHNVDGVGDACGVPDYAGGVDNSLIDLNAALPALAPDDPIDLQAEIDNALGCASDAPASECTRLDLIVSVTPGDGCANIQVLNGEGEALADSFPADLVDGALRGRVTELALSIPYQAETMAVDIDLAVTNVVLSADVSETALTNIVIGGSLERMAFEDTIRDLLPLLGGDIDFDDIGGILANLYDVQVGGTCSALSVGLTGSATAVAP